MRDTAILQSGQLILVVVQAAANFVLIRLLNRSQYGAYILILALAGLAGVLDLTGSARVTITQLSQAVGADDRDSIRDSLAYFVRINALYNGPLVAIFFVIAPVVAWALYHDPQISQWVGWLALIELTDLPTQLLGIAYQSRGTMRRLVSYESSRVVLTAVITISLLLLGHGIGALITSTLAISVLYAGISIWRYHQLALTDARFPNWKALLSRVRTVPFRGRFRVGFTIAVDKNLGSLLDKLIRLFIGTFGTIFVGDFDVAFKIVTLPQPLVSGISRNLDTFLPKRAGQHIQGGALREAFLKTTMYTGALWAVLTLGMAVAAPVLLLVAFPAYQNALPMIFPLLLQSIGVGLGVGIGPTLRTLRRLEFSIMSQIVTIASILPLGMLLVARWGEYGVGWLIGIQEIGQVAAMVAVILWLTRPRSTESSAEPSTVA
ncbi:MAG: lipopolysaccharide biosynthesis protein [Aggregatilineales bacterium]